MSQLYCQSTIDMFGEKEQMTSWSHTTPIKVVVPGVRGRYVLSTSQSLSFVKITNGLHFNQDAQNSCCRDRPPLGTLRCHAAGGIGGAPELPERPRLRRSRDHCASWLWYLERCCKLGAQRVPRLYQ